MTTTRLPKKELTGVYGKLVKIIGTKMVGAVPEPAEVMWHSPRVVKSLNAFGGKVRKWNDCDEALKTFAHMAVASLVGCSWCLDLNYFLAHTEGLDERKASQVPRWRDSDVFTPLERDVLEYAEAMTQTPPTVTDQMVDGLTTQLGPAAVVELTAAIGFANATTRGNNALGIESQGFSAACEFTLAQPSRPGASAQPLASKA
ncbi:carboxymuconolactone decarboxylase family protein [Gordonia sp. CPCC 205333]|uniref:carboxymuconolactone decarboxylase family protein n=1 Tax=Gordonia sp. CPCC 205333 TaxID=3140790 RepID=UPI003AF3FF02